MYRFRAWANQRTLDSVQACPAAQQDAMPILAHMLAAEHIWLSRLQGQQPRLVVWPTLTLDECQALLIENKQAWPTYLAELTENRLQTLIDYRTSRGDPMRNTVIDILIHTFNHGQHHAGQIARIVGRTGGKAAVTDYIAYVRDGRVG